VEVLFYAVIGNLASLSDLLGFKIWEIATLTTGLQGSGKISVNISALHAPWFFSPEQPLASKPSAGPPTEGHFRSTLNPC
jgi:hypothetical protein